MMNEQAKVTQIESTPEIREKLKSCVKVSVAFTHPETGEVTTMEETGIQFVGALLVPVTEEEDKGNRKLAYMLVGGGTPMDIVHMMKDLSDHMAKSAVEIPELKSASMGMIAEEMLGKLLSRSERKDPLAEALERFKAEGPGLASILGSRTGRTPMPGGLGIKEILKALENEDAEDPIADMVKADERVRPQTGCDCPICSAARALGRPEEDDDSDKPQPKEQVGCGDPACKACYPNSPAAGQKGN